MKTIIFGERSFLTSSIRKKLKKVRVFSINKFLKSNERNRLKSEKVNIIINSFFPSYKLNKSSNLDELYRSSIYDLNNLLNELKKFKINHLIYSSSSSIYTIANRKHFENFTFKKYYAITKLICENKIKDFATKKNLNYFVARIFNMYGDGDNFSIISKIINSYKKKKILNLINNGEGVRDFIHVDDVAQIYINKQKKKIKGTFDIGHGYGYKIYDILREIGLKKFKIKNSKINEEQILMAKNKPLDLFLNVNKNKLENFLKKKFKLKKKMILKKYTENSIKEINGSIIYGAGNAGKQIYKILTKENKNAVFCFVDDNKKLNKTTFDKKKIISYKQLINLKEHYTIKNIIIAIPSLKKEKLSELVKKLKIISSNVNFLNLNKVTNDRIFLNDIIDGSLVDLLERKISKLDKNLIRKLNNKTILVTGAGGSIGKELCKQLSKLKLKKIIALENNELNYYKLKNSHFINKNFKLILGNILDTNLLNFLDKKFNIDVIFHTAAYKHVNILEKNIYPAVENNIFGTLNLLETFKNKNKKFVLISTDKAARPKNILGFTKRISEIISQNYSSKLKICIVRFGNVFGSQGSAINLFIEQINKGGPVTITNKKVKRYFMSINEACNLVIQSSQINGDSKIFILNMGKPIKIIDIIKKLINYKKQKNPHSKIKIKEIGLESSEKLSEKLTYTNKLTKTTHPDILMAREPEYSRQDLDNFLKELIKNFKGFNEIGMKRSLKKFLKKEISI